MSVHGHPAVHARRSAAVPPAVAASSAIASASASASASAVAVAVAVAVAAAVAFAVAFALLLIYWVPSARQTRRANTRRAARRMRDVFRWHMDVPSKNARRACGPGARSAEGALRGVLSFGYFSLHKQRKVTRASGSCCSCFKASSFKASKSQSQNQGKGKGFRLTASHFSLLAQRKVTKRKRALPCALRASRSGSADAPGIRGRGILPLPRTAHILVRRPSGFSPVHPPLRKGTR